MTTKTKPESHRDYVAKALDISLAFCYRGPRTISEREKLGAWLDTGEEIAPRRILNAASRLLGIPPAH